MTARSNYSLKSTAKISSSPIWRRARLIPLPSTSTSDRNSSLSLESKARETSTSLDISNQMPRIPLNLKRKKNRPKSQRKLNRSRKINHRLSKNQQSPLNPSSRFSNKSNSRLNQNQLSHSRFSQSPKSRQPLCPNRPKNQNKSRKMRMRMKTWSWNLEMTVLYSKTRRNWKSQRIKKLKMKMSKMMRISMRKTETRKLSMRRMMRK